MDRRERNSDAQTALTAALQGWQAGLWTSLPGIVQSFDADAETVTVQPTIQARVRDRDGFNTWVSLPLLVDVPVVFPGGGGFTLTFPVAAGDECLVVFASRCIDAWWQSGGVQPQAELRMHDLSDGFAFVGLKSQPRTLAGGVSSGGAQLRSDDGATSIEVADGTVTITAASINIVGDITTTGTITNNGKDIGSAHTHSGVTPGGGSTGSPN